MSAEESCAAGGIKVDDDIKAAESDDSVEIAVALPAAMLEEVTSN